jgi:hypothetical protein
MTLGQQLYVYIEIDVIQVIAGVPTPVTYRFGDHGTPPPLGVTALPILVRHETQAARLAISQGLGIRERVTFTLSDFVDDGDVAGGAPSTPTPFWPLFRARIPFLTGRPLRQVRGTVSGGTFTAAQTLHYMVRKIEGPQSNGSVSIEAEDLTGTLARGKAQCPPASRVTLAEAITAASIGATVTHAADLDEWPDSGMLRIGDEAMQYAVSEVPGGTKFLTFAARGALGTTAVDHDAGAEVQPIARWVNKRLCDIVYDLLVVYAGIPAEQIDLPEWEAADDEYLDFSLSAVIWSPTEVDALLSDLLKIFPLAVWYDPRGPSWGFRPLDAVAFAGASPLLDDAGGYVANSMTIREDPDQAWTRMLLYHGVRDVTSDASKPADYQVARLFRNDEAELPEQRGRRSLRQLLVRWMDADQSVDVDRIGQQQQRNGRHDRRTVTLTVPIDADLRVGDFCRLRTRRVIDADGAPVTSSMLVTSSKEIQDGAQLELELTDLYYRGNYRRYAPDGLPAYDSATPAQTGRYGYYADDTDTLGAAAEPAHTYM